MLVLALLTAAGLAAPSEDSWGACEDVGTWFQRWTGESRARGFGNSLGSNINDFDGDGDNDIYVAMGPARIGEEAYYPGESLLYLSRFDASGEVVFDEVGASWGVDDICEDRAPMFGDLDNDGLPDLYVTVNGRNLLYRNDGYGRYVDVTARSGAAGDAGWGHQGGLLDYDRDGFLDIFYTNGPEDGSGYNTLLRNQADGTFKDVSVEAGIAGDPSGKGSCILDADGDGWMDLFVTTGREFGNHLFMNQGDGTFVDEALERGVSDPLLRFGVGAVCEDLDNDGDVDIYLITHDKVWSGNQLFMNDGGVFTDVATAAGVADWVDPHGLALVDVDRDGFLDILISGIRIDPWVFHNNGDMTFTRLCDGAGIQQEEGLSWAVAGGDLNDDGYPEVYITHGLGRRPRENELFLNVAQKEGVQNHWLTVEVQGLTHNPSAIGAKIEVEGSDGVTRTRWVGTWFSFDAQGPLPVTFGMGDAARADAIRVTLTNGDVIELSDVDVDQYIVVVEDTDRSDDDSDGVPDEWDICPGTRLGERSDGEGCAVGQRSGAPVGLVSPAQDGVLVDGGTFEWEGELESAVLQVSFDGTFGPAGRLDYGPFSGGSYTLSDEDWAALQDLSDGTFPLLWRVVGVGADGGAVQTEPRRFHVAIPTQVVTIPEGANIFEPAHIVVDRGESVTWWNDSVAAGNLQNEIHDVQLIDAEGRAATHLHQLSGAGFATWTFNEPGLWSYVCLRHTGSGTASDQLMEGEAAHRGDGPYRCMAGTITVR